MNGRLPADRYVLFAVVAAAGLAWDLVSKSVVFGSLGYPGGESAWHVRWFGDAITFRLHTTFNHGALWGVGQGFSWLFAALSVLAVVGIVLWLFVWRAARSRWLTVALAFVTAGTLGNLYDRLGLHGYVDPVTRAPYLAVRDFLLFTFGSFHWPVFNFADVFLVTGAIMLVVQSLLLEASASGESPRTSTPDDAPDSVNDRSTSAA